MTAAEAPTKAVRVLLVDDTEDLRRLTALVLEQRGTYTVVAEAADGLEAVRQAHEHQPDLVVLDVSMPGMDGLQALPLIRAAAPAAVVVMLSAFEGNRLAETALARGATAYLEKGLPPSELATRIDDAFAGRSHESTPPPAPLRDDELHAVVAHDLRGPLGAIIGFGATAETSWPLLSEDQRRDMVRRMTRQAKLLQNVTDNLLAYRAMEIGAVAVDEQDIDYRSFLPGARDDLAPLAVHHELAIEISDDTGPIRGDPGRLRQVLTNLVGNSVRYAPAETTITIRAWRDRAGTVLSVLDEGPGIAPGDRHHVFDKHVRLGPSQGLGLGLFVCAELVRAMDGTIWVADPPAGAEVCVRLPSVSA